MTLGTVFFLLVALPAADELDGRCEGQMVTSAQSSGPLALAREGDRLVLAFASQDASVGLTYPMRVEQQGRRLIVTISKPSERVSMPAFGTNHGRVVLPAGLAGKYRLEVRFGKVRARYELEIGDVVRVVGRGEVAPQLAFAADAWRSTPPGLTRVHCVENSACAVAACADLWKVPPISTMPALASGAYLDATLYARSCIGRLSEPELEQLRVAAADLAARGCGALVIDAPSAR